MGDRKALEDASMRLAKDLAKPLPAIYQHNRWRLEKIISICESHPALVSRGFICKFRKSSLEGLTEGIRLTPLLLLLKCGPPLKVLQSFIETHKPALLDPVYLLNNRPLFFACALPFVEMKRCPGVLDYLVKQFPMETTVESRLQLLDGARSGHVNCKMLPIFALVSSNYPASLADVQSLFQATFEHSGTALTFDKARAVELLRSSMKGCNENDVTAYLTEKVISSGLDCLEAKCQSWSDCNIVSTLLKKLSLSRIDVAFGEGLNFSEIFEEIMETWTKNAQTIKILKLSLPKKHHRMRAMSLALADRLAALPSTSLVELHITFPGDGTKGLSFYYENDHLGSRDISSPIAGLIQRNPGLKKIILHCWFRVEPMSFFQAVESHGSSLEEFKTCFLCHSGQEYQDALEALVSLLGRSTSLTSAEPRFPSGASWLKDKSNMNLIRKAKYLQDLNLLGRKQARENMYELVKVLAPVPQDSIGKTNADASCIRSKKPNSDKSRFGFDKVSLNYSLLRENPSLWCDEAAADQTRTMCCQQVQEA